MERQVVVDETVKGSFYIDGKINLVGVVLGVHAGVIAWMVTGDLVWGAIVLGVAALIGSLAWWALCRDPWRKQEKQAPIAPTPDDPQQRMDHAA